jgi:hypothetical protein
MSEGRDRHWVPDHPDGSGWGDVDWVSAAKGSRYHYRHAESDERAQRLRPPYFRIVTRLDTPGLHAPHENTYYIPSRSLTDFLAELVLAGGNEEIWHVEPCPDPPQEANLGERERLPDASASRNPVPDRTAG